MQLYNSRYSPACWHFYLLPSINISSAYETHDLGHIRLSFSWLFWSLTHVFRYHV